MIAKISIEKYGRFWKVIENGELLAVCVYKKGAEAIVARLKKLSTY